MNKKLDRRRQRTTWSQTGISLLVFSLIQSALWLAIDQIPWSDGADVSGPYRNVPTWVPVAYWSQFLALLFAPSQIRIFVSAQILLGVVLVRLPAWNLAQPLEPHGIAIDLAWVVYLLQCLATGWWLLARRRQIADPNESLVADDRS